MKLIFSKIQKSIFLLTIFIFVSTCSNNKSGINIEDRGGALIDKIIFDVRTDMTIAIKDVAEGKADLMASGIDGSVYLSLERKDLERRIIELEYKQIELKKELSRAKIRKVMISANCNCWLCEE